MTKNAVSKEWAFTDKGTLNNYNSWQPDGSNSFVATGTGFGVGPTVVMFDRFLGQADGETVNQNADVGSWRAAGNFSFNNRPPIITFDGRKGVSHNDPAAGQGNTRFGLGVENLDYVRFTEFCKAGVPAGKTFPGATVAETFPAVSSIKPNWHNGYGWNGSNGEIDIVTWQHSGSGTFYATGNNIEGHQINGLASAWEWDEWNSVLSIYQPDSPDIQGPNGKSNIRVVNSAGSYVELQDPFACWKSLGDPLPTPFKFDRVGVFAWSGNGTHTDSQFVMTSYYLAVGDNSSKYIALANNVDITLATDIDVICWDAWTDTRVDFTPSDAEIAAHTHWFIMDDQAILATGALA